MLDMERQFQANLTIKQPIHLLLMYTVQMLNKEEQFLISLNNYTAKTPVTDLHSTDERQEETISSPPYNRIAKIPETDLHSTDDK